jgi:uncharacterized protein (TIGR03435 family)
MSIRIAACLSILPAGLAFSQEERPRGSEFAAVPATVANDKLPEFEVADVQTSKAVGPPRARFLPGGKVQFDGLPMKFMVQAAWGYENDESRVTGGPSWVNSEKYDIVAKAPHDVDIPTLRLMLRQLLIKRFGLEMHIQDAAMPVYGLEKGKGNPKITASEKTGAPDCQRGFDNGVISLTCHNMTMDELANGLRAMAPAYIDKPVVNLTGLTGQYDFKMGWTPRGQLLGTGDGVRAAGGAAQPDGGVLNVGEATAGGITIFEAVEKHLGLKLASVKHAMPIIVIDKVNKTPVEN